MDLMTKKLWDGLGRMGRIRPRLIVKKVGWMGRIGTDKKQLSVPPKHPLSPAKTIFWDGWDGYKPTLLELIKKYIKVVINRKNRKEKTYRNLDLSVPSHPSQAFISSFRALENPTVIA